jgi:glyoxylase-like metal-dependent hydrolase (beta-lactamase superfamily II)
LAIVGSCRPWPPCRAPGDLDEGRVAFRENRAMSPAATPAAALPAYVEPLDRGIYAIDTGFMRPRFDAAYLMVQDGRAAYIDTGTGRALPRLLGALDALGLARDAVDWVIPTHVHLDHAGAAGALMRELPEARLLIHPRGARHMIDPSALWAGATEVYGPEEMARSYGEVVPIDADRVLTTSEGMTIELAGRPLQFADTPGHARHHHCIWDEATRGWFTGDTFGISYREFDTAQGPWMLPTTTPVQFEPEVLIGSMQRLLARQPQWIYLTHFGRIGEPQRLGRQLIGLIEALVALGRREQSNPERHEALKRGQLDLFCASLAAHGCTMPRAMIAELLAIDLQLNAQGMAIWLDRDKS